MPTSFHIFNDQREKFCRWLKAEVLKDPGRLGMPSTERASNFAEELILCLTEENVPAIIRKDLEGARSLLVVADKVTAIIEKENSISAQALLKDAAPFYLLASVVLDKCKFRDKGTFDVTL